MERKIIIIAEEFPEHPGGVSYFSDVLAKGYYKNGELKGVISLSTFLPAQRNFPVIHLSLPKRTYGNMLLDEVVFFRKINTLLFYGYEYFYNVFYEPIKKALTKLNYDPSLDILFFTYQVHFPKLFYQLYSLFKGEQWILYHGLDLLGFKTFPKDINRTLSVAQKVIFNSKATKDLFQHLGFQFENKEVKYPSLDTDYLSSLELYSLKEIETMTGIKLEGFFLISSICRLVKRKGIHFAIEIVKELIGLYPGKVQYLIAGSGPEEPLLRQLVVQSNLEERIHFLGYVDDRLKYSLMNVSRVFLMPNFNDGGNDFEGFGISFLEAGYYDNYVVSGTHGGACEAIKLVPNGISIEHNINGKKTAIKKIKEHIGD